MLRETDSAGMVPYAVFESYNKGGALLIKQNNNEPR